MSSQRELLQAAGASFFGMRWMARVDGRNTVVAAVDGCGNTNLTDAGHALLHKTFALVSDAPEGSADKTPPPAKSARKRVRPPKPKAVPETSIASDLAVDLDFSLVGEAA
jgi:hypothetical protein